MKPSIKAGTLFANKAKSGFLSLTGSRYDGMVTRLAKKKLPPLPFTKEQFRAHVLAALGGFDDGAVQCRYCRSYFALGDLAVDHAKPLSRGGSAGLDNIEFPCKPCNDRKGRMTPDEFLALLAFLETIPLARIDILKRLEQSVKLAAQQRFNIARQRASEITGARSLARLPAHLLGGSSARGSDRTHVPFARSRYMALGPSGTGSGVLKRPSN